MTTSAIAPALLMDSVNKFYGDGENTVTALGEVNLRVEPGEFLAIVGPSGSGKSTLLAVAGALATPDSGTVAVGGEALGDQTPAQLAALRREHIGFVFQSGNLPAALTAREQLVLAQKITGRDESRSPEELLAAVGMEHRASFRPGQMSGGERQRVGIARALVGRPDLLLVDEPTSALDQQRSRDIVGLLAKQSHEHGVGTIMVTHDHSILDLCDRVCRMVDGRLSAVD